MFECIWTSVKAFMMMHTQHAWLENLLIILAIIGAITVVTLLTIIVIRVIKHNKKIKEKIIKDTNAIDKKILTLLKEKNNKTF